MFMGKTILAVDDEAQTRDFFSTVLEESGYTPVLAEDGEQAMEIILQNKPDLIILDIMMPKQSGIKIYRQLKRDESFKNIPVIICSGLPRRTLLRAQAALTQTSGESVPEPDAYLEKPVTPERLEATIKKILG
jgi:twitching motility two-component system response regulator PilH